MSALVEKLRAAADQARDHGMPSFGAVYEEAATEIENLNQALALKMGGLPSGLTAAQAELLEKPVGDHIKAAIRSGGQLMVKQAMKGKWIFNAQIMFVNGEGTVGNISTSEEGALQNLEGVLKLQTGK